MNVLAHEVKRPVTDHSDVTALANIQLSASTLCHNEVYNHEGEKLGKLFELILDLPSGQLSYGIVSNGGFWGIGERLFAAPWQALTLDRNLKRFILPVSLKRLELAPSFTTDSWPDMDDSRWAKEIHNFYGVGHARPE